MNPLHFAIVFVLFCSGFDNVRAAACGPELMVCFEGIDLENMSMDKLDPHEMDMPAICRMVNCLKNLPCELSGEQQSMTAMTSQLEGFCPEDGSDPSACSIITLQACIGDLAKVNEPTQDDLKKACPARKCLAGLLPTCKGLLQTQVKTLVDQMAAICVEGCEIEKLLACVPQETQGDMSSDDITKESCEEMKKAQRCVEPMLPKCQGNISESIQFISSAGKCCDKIIQVKEDCIPEDPDKLFEDGDVDSCKKKEDAYSCVMISKLECTEPVQTFVDEMKQKGRKAVESCEKQGYNLTISIESGKSLNDPGMGVALQPSAPILFALVLAVLSWWF